MASGTSAQPYIEQLERLPFVQRARVFEPKKRSAKHQPDMEVVLRTPTGERHLLVEVKTSHLSTAEARALVARTSEPGSWLLMAPAIGAGIGELLEEHGFNFIDRTGNCYLSLGPGYLARVQGPTTPERRGSAKGIRAAGYQVLFALLARPALMQATVREIAAAAGVSRTPVSDMLARLVESGWAVRIGSEHQWVPHRMRAALDMWVHGYSQVVRPKLLIGTLRPREVSIPALEQHIAGALEGVCEWRFGGAAAAHRIEGHYRGLRTVVHVADRSEHPERRLAAARDPNGTLVVLGLPGPLALEGVSPDTVHPLLAYSELLMEHHDRASEAAQRLMDEFPLWP